jgi:hypothetical protein
VGEAGRVGQSSAGAKSLKLRDKGLSGCHPSGQQPRQPDRGPEGQIKNYSSDNLLKETELKAPLIGNTRRAKGSPPTKAQQFEEKKIKLTLGSKFAVVERGDDNR